jgi:hypothetical protein
MYSSYGCTSQDSSIVEFVKKIQGLWIENDDSCSYWIFVDNKLISLHGGCPIDYNIRNYEISYRSCYETDNTLEFRLFVMEKRDTLCYYIFSGLSSISDYFVLKFADGAGKTLHILRRQNAEPLEEPLENSD